MFETQGGTRNRTRDLPKKGSAFITSSDHWTAVAGMAGHQMQQCKNGWRYVCVFLCFQTCSVLSVVACFCSASVPDYEADLLSDQVDSSGNTSRPGLERPVTIVCHALIY